MGLFDRLFAGERLPRLPKTARIADVDALHVRTAGELVVCSMDTTGLRALIDAAADRIPLQLRGPGRRTTFVPVTKVQKIVLDPDHGWIIPLVPEACADIATWEVAPSEHQLGSLAVVVE
ncbi:hypothetical protein C3B44_07830 [Corynebacterium yudongzhengii]|uniref:Uncharacterized protein n=1 Tax=Corynebacterium yudongzhengii TaxID=2080740 RepID=A0A2U1T6S9_9CORY|nr:hypothetical protein [Corynebacterium yudongzhengii]AWB82272.1 hypothetical protein C3B44_07830 [Corynebacterium yudongzhengii]PWC01721.1 hypothetical protein DF222_06350 [Corynebacterium yudongzhengii]